ncbi:MAG: hypothetical protein Q9188_007604 [Gyalolechia gomerana]
MAPPPAHRHTQGLKASPHSNSPRPLASPSAQQRSRLQALAPPPSTPPISPPRSVYETSPRKGEVKTTLKTPPPPRRKSFIPTQT